MYGMVHTLVTIMYPLNVLSRYGNNPGPRHIQFAKHLLRYVRTSKMDRLMFKTRNGPFDMKTMYFQCDADFAGNLDNKHSQTSYRGYLGGSLICWCSTDQGSISTFTAESELKAVNHTLKCGGIANRDIFSYLGNSLQISPLSNSQSVQDVSFSLSYDLPLRNQYTLGYLLQSLWETVSIPFVSICLCWL